MRVPFYIARRYLFAKKSHNIINIISIISLIGVATGVMALVIVLSVFNGFDSLIARLYSSIDSDVRILPAEGKTFTLTHSELDSIRRHKGVAVFAEIFEENALFRYKSKQHIGVIKGVSGNYADLTGVDSMLVDGEFKLWNGSQPMAIMGQGVAYYLNASLAHFDPLAIFVPKRGKATLSMESAFGKKYIMASGVFAIEQDFDSQFIIAPVEFVRELLGYDSTTVTSIEIKAAKGYSSERLKSEVEQILGTNYKVQNRYQQNESLYRTMKSEKFAIGMILTLILIIASFNIVGSLSMLIIEKRKDVETLRSLGADNDLIRKIFMAEGLLISIGGTIIGTILGLVVCWAQITFKLIKLEGRGNFIIDAYPVDIQLGDIGLILLVVLTIGFIAARFPVRMITKRILNANERDSL
ncbi:MAG: ABC transporter permease [Bacteroidales bacterium]|nr:ABC transporter permease [Bacteroidales bacterium]